MSAQKQFTGRLTGCMTSTSRIQGYQERMRESTASKSLVRLVQLVGMKKASTD